MPSTVERVYKQLNIPPEFYDVPPAFFEWQYFKPGMLLGHPEPIFPRKE